MRKRTGRTKSMWAIVFACMTAALITGCGQTNSRQSTVENSAESGVDDNNSAENIRDDDSAENGSDDDSADVQEILPTIAIEGAETLLEGRFYRIPINTARIENDYFTMEVPEDLLENTSCIVEIGADGDGCPVLEKAFFFVDSIVKSYQPKSGTENDAERAEIFDFVFGGGWLGGIFWADVTDYEAEGILGELVERSGTTDISKMNHCYNELFAPVGRQVITANGKGTGAYFLIEPSDVQYDTDNILETEEYIYGKSAFLESLSSFTPKTFPMEKDYQQLYEAGEVSAAPSSSAVLAAFQSLEKAYAESSGYTGEYAYDAYEAEYIITVDEANDKDASLDTDGINSGVTATISMRCTAEIHGVFVVDVFEYTMIQDEEHEWRLTQDFVLPMERLTDPRFLFASSLPKDGIYINESTVTDLNRDGMPEVYLISAGGHEYHIFYYLNDSIQQLTGTFWTWTSNLFSTANGYVVAYAEPHTTGTAGNLQYTVYEWGEEGFTLKEELWQIPAEWSDVDGQPTGYQYLASEETIDPFDDKTDYSDLVITQEEFERRLDALGSATSLFEDSEYEYTPELSEQSLIFSKIRTEILEWQTE